MSDEDTRYSGVLSASSPTRRVARNSIAVFLLSFLLVTFLLSYRLAALVSVGVAVSYAIVQILGARYCVTCGLPVFRQPWSRQAVRCPACGSECRFAWRSQT